MCHVRGGFPNTFTAVSLRLWSITAFVVKISLSLLPWLVRKERRWLTALWANSKEVSETSPPIVQRVDIYGRSLSQTGANRATVFDWRLGKPIRVYYFGIMSQSAPIKAFQTVTGDVIDLMTILFTVFVHAETVEYVYFLFLLNVFYLNLF